MGARLLQPWHQMRSKSGTKGEKLSQSRGNERLGAYALYVLASTHSGCEARECEADGEDAPHAFK